MKSKRTWRLLAVGVVAVIGVGSWGVMQVFASSNSAPPASRFDSVGKLSPYAPPVGNPYWSVQLLKTYVNRQASGAVASVPAFPGFAPIDPLTTITCAPTNAPHGATCGVVADMTAQLGGSTAGNQTTLVTAVDGSFVSDLPFLGLIPNGTYAAFHWQNVAVGLPAGTHTVQTFATSSNGAFSGDYSVQYKVYSNP